MRRTAEQPNSGGAVGDLTDTLAKAKAAGATVLVTPYRSGDRRAAMLKFPGGYIAEVHDRRP